MGCAHQHYRWVPCKCQTSSCTAPGTLSCLQLSSLFVSLPALTHLGFHQLPAHVLPLSPCDLILTTPAPLQSSESHPHLASIKARGAANKTYAFHAWNSQLPLISWQIRGIKVYCEESWSWQLISLVIWGLGSIGPETHGSKMESNSFFGMMHVFGITVTKQNCRHLSSPIDFGLAILKHSKGVRQVLQFGFLKWMQAFNSAKLFCLSFV